MQNNIYANVGDVARALNLSAETIRYYVKEGLISPRKNPQSGYWEYSSNDTMKLADILYYRSMYLPVEDIKLIMGGLPVEQLGDVITNRIKGVTDELHELTRALHLLNGWYERYRSELALVGKIVISDMPSEYRREGTFDETQHLAHYIEQCFELDKDDWTDTSISFLYDTTKPEPEFTHYFSIKAERKIKAKNIINMGIEEKASNCLMTQVRYNSDPKEMIKLLVEYAAENDIPLEGKFYGRETTDYFEDGHHTALYRIYAPIVSK